MSIWEKLAAAVGDVSMGAALGGWFDNRAARGVSTEDALPFTMGMVTLGAKMAKADGVVIKDEVIAFKNVFKVSDAEMANAARVFNLAKQDTTGYEICAEQLATLFKGDRNMLEYILEGLFHIATADGVLHPHEEQFLGQVAKRFGFTPDEFSFMKARHAAAHDRNPYDMLGVKPSVSDEELERQYKRMVAQAQPDKFIERGMPKEFVLIATAKLAALKEAYEAIARERHMA